MSRTFTAALAGLSLAIMTASAVYAQSLEEIALTFERAGFVDE